MERGVSLVRGIVRGIDGDGALVEVEQGGCGRCHEEGGCGGRPLTQMFCSGPKVHRVENGIGARVGDQVDIAVAPGSLSRTANRAYLFPLAAGIGGGASGMAIGGDLLSIVGFLLGLGVAFFILNRQSRTENPASRPHIVSRAS